MVQPLDLSQIGKQKQAMAAGRQAYYHQFRLQLTADLYRERIKCDLDKGVTPMKRLEDHVDHARLQAIHFCIYMQVDIVGNDLTPNEVEWIQEEAKRYAEEITKGES